MAGTTRFVTAGHTYAIFDSTTYLLSYSTESTNPLYIPYSTITEAGPSPTTTISYGPQIDTESLPVVSVGGALLITPPNTTTALTTTPVATTSAATTSAATNSGLTSSSSLATTSTTAGAAPAAATTVRVIVPAKNNTAAIAGAAVACLIGGALIAGLLVWLIMSSRLKKKHRSSANGGFARHHRSQASNEKALPSAPLLGAAGAGIGAAGAAGNWQAHLPQPDSDSTITRSVKGLFDHIEVHVENFYRDAPVALTGELQAALLAVDSRHLPDSVVGLLPQTERPTLLIKHVIAAAVVSRIDYESAGVGSGEDEGGSFLPAEFVGLMKGLPYGGVKSDGGARGPAFTPALSQWRVLSAYLRSSSSSQSSPSTSTRDARIATLADTLCRTFEPWALSRDSFASRRDNLINIMRAGSETGVLLFSQPGSFRWRWNAPTGSGKRIRVVVAPGLDKVRDESARELERPVELVRPAVGVLIG